MISVLVSYSQHHESGWHAGWYVLTMYSFLVSLLGACDCCVRLGGEYRYKVSCSGVASGLIVPELVIII